jgi:hypothetical protein
LEECFSAGNFQLTDEESTGGIYIPPIINSSWTRNLQEEGDSVRNYQLNDAVSDW